jgi:hypothetical protein
MAKTNLAVGEMPRQMQRTTVRNYGPDLALARAVFDERTAFRFTNHHDPEIDEQIHKSIGDALNNEWERDITIERWAERAIEAMGLARRGR